SMHPTRLVNRGERAEQRVEPSEGDLARDAPLVHAVGECHTEEPSCHVKGPAAPWVRLPPARDDARASDVALGGFRIRARAITPGRTVHGARDLSLARDAGLGERVAYPER